MATKSVKISNIDNFASYRAVKPNERYAIAYRTEVDDFAVFYHLNYGTLGMSTDLHETFDSIEELEQAMRGFADLRKWSVYEF